MVGSRLREESVALRDKTRVREIGASLAVFALVLGPALLVAASASAQSATPAGDLSGAGLRGGSGPTSAPPQRRPGDAPTIGDPAFSGLVSPPSPPASYSAGAGEPSPDSVINYARPRKRAKSPKPNPAIRPGRPALPALEAYKTSYAARRQQKAQAVADPDRPPEPPPTGVAVVPTIAVKTHKKPEDKPFDPVGLEVGSLRLKPYVEALGGYDTNPNRVQTPQKGSTLGRVEAGVAIESDWSRHSVTGELRAGYSDYFSKRSADRPDAAGKIDGRIDVTRDTSIDLGANVNVTTLRQGSPEIQGGGKNVTQTNQPINWSVGSYAGATHRFNRLELSMRGTIERNETGDATFSNNTIQKLHLNDYTTVGVKPRVSYDLSPRLKPFVEATVDKRTYDQLKDVNGYRRNSTGFTVRGGASFEIDGALKGEASGGYLERDYEDPRLVQLHGPALDASLIWTPTPLTTVTLRGSTTANETTVPNASGAIVRKVSGEISHALLRNLTISGLTSYQVTSYQGANISSAYKGSSTGFNERLFSATVKAEYSLTRTVAVKASYGYERLKSTVPGSDYTANVFLLGLRLQR